MYVHFVLFYFLISTIQNFLDKCKSLRYIKFSVWAALDLING